MAARSRLLALLLLALAGCPKKPPGPTPSEATCEQVGAALVQSLAADLAASGSTQPDAALINRAVVQAVIESCTRDAWSASARSCFLDARSDASEKCHAEFTETQVQGLEDRIDSAVAKAAPASCADLDVALQASKGPLLEQAPADQREALDVKLGTFIAAVAGQCAAGWPVEARTCVRDAVRDQADLTRCMRWLDETQRQAYDQAVVAAFGAPPSGEPGP